MSKGYREAVAAQSPELTCFDVKPGGWTFGFNPVGVDFNSMEIPRAEATVGFETQPLRSIRKPEPGARNPQSQIL